MLLREKNTLAIQDPHKASARLSLQHRKAESENSYYHSFTRILPFENEAYEHQAGKLFGLSFAAKDVFGVGGYPVSAGIEIPPIAKAPRTAEVVALFQRLGAALFGLTNLDELCLTNYGQNQKFGRVLHPFQPELCPLGSSSGSAVAVARNQVDFALGTDFGGSIRLPAAACGLTGIKCTPGILSPSDALLFGTSLDCPGLLVKSPEDLQFIWDQIPGSASADQFDSAILYIPNEQDLGLLEPGLRRCFEAVLNNLSGSFSLQQLGTQFTYRAALEARKILAIETVVEKLAEWKINHETLPDSARAVLAFHATLSRAEIAAAVCQRHIYEESVGVVLAQQGILLTPTLPRSIPSWENFDQSEDGKTALNFFLALANLCELPAVAMPIKTTDSAPPFSIQLVGPKGSDGALINLSAQLGEDMNPE